MRLSIMMILIRQEPVFVGFDSFGIFHHFLMKYIMTLFLKSQILKIILTYKNIMIIDDLGIKNASNDFYITTSIKF